MPNLNSTATALASEDLVFALTSIDGATAACRAHGDVETAAVLGSYYALVAQAIAATEGRIVKVIGDGVLMVFPLRRAKDAVAALRLLQTSANALLSGFDVACRHRVKVGSGHVAAGMMGPPGAERFDVYGTALNELFKAPGGAFLVTPALAALLG